MSMRRSLAVDVDGDRVVHFRDDEHGGERGVAALVGVEGRDAHQAVHADLLLQVAEGELALVAHGDALDARFLAGQDVGDLGLEAQALAEAQVHAQQDLGPVLALGAAGAGVDAQEGVAGVAFAVEVMLDLGLLDVFLEMGHFFFQFRRAGRGPRRSAGNRSPVPRWRSPVSRPPAGNCSGSFFLSAGGPTSWGLLQMAGSVSLASISFIGRLFGIFQRNPRRSEAFCFSSANRLLS